MECDPTYKQKFVCCICNIQRVQSVEKKYISAQSADCMQENVLPRRAFIEATAMALAGVFIPKIETPLASANLVTYECIPAINPGWATNTNGEPRLDERYVNQLRADGSRSMRIEYSLRGHDIWTYNLLYQYEQMCKFAQSAGMKISLLVDQGTVWGHPYEWDANNTETQGGDGTNPYMDKLIDTTAMIIDRYGGYFDAIEVWNEPEHPDTRISESVMARLLTGMYDRVKPLKPSIDIVYGGHMISSGTEYLDKVFAYGEEHCGWTPTAPKMNALGLHFYNGQGRLVTDYDFTYNLSGLRRSLPDWMPIDLKEVGWMSDGTVEGEFKQAKNIQTLFEYIPHHPEYLIREANIFNFQDYTLSDGRKITYGLYREDNTAKPSRDIFRKMTGVATPSTAN